MAKKTRPTKPRSRRSRRSAGEPGTLTLRIARLVEQQLALTQHGFAAPAIDRDRAESSIRWRRDDGFQVVLTFYGLGPIESFGIGVSPPNPNHACGVMPTCSRNGYFTGCRRSASIRSSS